MSSPKGALTIVFCSDFGSIAAGAGQAKVAIESAIGLKKAGHRVIFFTASGPVEQPLFDAGVEVHCLNQHVLLANPSRLAAAIQGTWNTTAAAALRKLLAGLPREDTVVHCHGWARALSPSIAPAIAASGLPACYSFHDYFSYCPGGGFYNFPKSHPCTLKPLSLPCWLTDCDQRNYMRKLWRNARLQFAHSVAHLPQIFSDLIFLSVSQREALERYTTAGQRLHRLSNPVNVRDLGPRQGPVSDAFIFVGRLAPEKGVLDFAEAARRVGIVPTFVGDGPVAAELSSRYPEARMLGWQSGESVSRLMREARALVFPSLIVEGQPLTVLEAKGHGLPVVVSDACAGRDEVEDGVTGLWFKGGDVADLSHALAEMRDDTRVAAMSDASYRSYWADPPTLDRHITGLIAIYDDMLSRRKQAPQKAYKTA